MNDCSLYSGDIVVFGAGKVVELATYYLETHSNYNIVAYTTDREFMPSCGFNSRPLIAWDELEEHYAPGDVRLMIPLTYQNLNALRRDRYRDGKARGYEFASFIHPDTSIHTKAIGDHCMIMERNMIGPLAQIGDNVILGPDNYIGHHSVVGNHSYAAARVSIAGDTLVGSECYFGIQACVAHGLTIGNRCAVLNGAFVTKNLPDKTVIIGQSGRIKPFSSDRIANKL